MADSQRKERMSETKALSVVRPRVNLAEWTVNVWASAVHHAANGGSAYPSYLDVFAEPLPVPPLGPTVPQCDRSDEAYDADLRKYKAQPSFDDRILDSVLAVERALEAVRAREWFVVFLLWKYPTMGRYGPSFRVYCDPDRPEWSFVESGVHHGLLNVCDSERKAVQQVRKCEREFFREMGFWIKKPARPQPIGVSCTSVL